MKQRLLIVTAIVAFMASGAMADGRVTVQPVFFVPSDSASITKNELRQYSDLLSAHLRLAREHWRRILGPDTFEVSREGIRVYQALNPDAYYVVPGPGKGPDTAHRMLKELFVKYGDNRDKSRFTS